MAQLQGIVSNTIGKRFGLDEDEAIFHRSIPAADLRWWSVDCPQLCADTRSVQDHIEKVFNGILDISSFGFIIAHEHDIKSHPSSPRWSLPRTCGWSCTLLKRSCSVLIAFTHLDFRFPLCPQRSTLMNSSPIRLLYRKSTLLSRVTSLATRGLSLFQLCQLLAQLML